MTIRSEKCRSNRIRHTLIKKLPRSAPRFFSVYIRGNHRKPIASKITTDINRISVNLKKNDELLQVLIDKNVIAEYVKGIPTEMFFNALSLDMANAGGENDKYLISNIRITKD